MKKMFFFLCAFFIFFQSANSRTYYVSARMGSDANNGYSWSTAKSTIDSALNVAISGDSIFVSIGQYAGFSPKDGVHIYGGFVGTEEYLNQRQTIKYGYLQNGLCTQIATRIYNSSQSGTAATNIDGLVIKGVNTQAIQIKYARISNCYVSAMSVSPPSNTYYWGIVLESSGSISNCKIENSIGVKLITNMLSNFTITNCIFTNNLCPLHIAGTATTTSYMPSIKIRNCDFISNHYRLKMTSPPFTGTVYSEVPGYLNIDACSFKNNSFINDSSYSGAIGLLNINRTYFKIHQCLFANNTVLNRTSYSYIIYQNGGYTPSGYIINAIKQIQNCTFVNNKSESLNPLYSPRGIYVNSTGTNLSLYNTIKLFSGNITSNATIFNIATFGDTNNVGTGFILVDSLNTGSDSTKNYVRFVRPTTFAGAATNSADSIAIMQADWHLDSGSACIDAGYGALPIQDTLDLEGNSRVSGWRIDIGAYEYPQADAPQQIVWSQNLQGKRLSEGFVVATATATSGLPVTYTSGNTRVATVSHDTIFFQSRGNATITATQWGDSVYMPATPLGKMLTVLDTIGVYDTIPVYDTVRSYDTIPVYDTLWHNDTIWHNDTLWTNDTIWYNDTTHTQVFDTTWTHLFDTIPVLDTTTIYIYDTIHIIDTIHIYDTTHVSIQGAEAVPWKIGQSGLNIIVSGAEGETVRVYDVSGRCLHVQPRAVGVLRFRMPTAGVYLVQVGGSPAQRIVLAVRE